MELLMEPEVQAKIAEFKRIVLKALYCDMHRVVPDNYDHERFSYDGIDRSQEFALDTHCFYLDWFITNAAEIYRTFAALGDQESKALYIDLLRYRLAGHLHVKINNAIPALRSQANDFIKRFPGEKSELASGGMFGDLRFYDIEWNGVRYTLDTIKNALLYTLVYRQYFFERNGVVVMPEAGDHVVDGGACTGDTAIIFSKVVGPQGAVYAFDPVQNHADICMHNFARAGYENIRLFACGLSNKTLEAPPVQLDSYAPGFRGGDQPIPLCRIDDLVADGRIARVDFLKLDVEGAEMDTLRGALESIKKFRPKLAISIYHKPNDMFEICNFLFDLELGYRFYLGHYTIHGEEIVLYCKP